MNFEEFTDYIYQNVLSGWKDHASVTIHKIKKNNGVVYTGLYIREEEGCVTPAIYLDSFYQSYRLGEEADEIIAEIRRQYDWAMSRTASFSHDITSYACIRDKLIYRLVNYEKNKEMLSNCPHIRLEDLAVTFRWLAHEDSVGISTALITHQELELWDVSMEEIFLEARKNTRRLFPAKIMLMDQFLKQIRVLPLSGEKVPMYILTNEQQINGATVLLYEHLLEDFAGEHPGNYYIMPSSIHEVILIPAHMVEDPEELPLIVHHANSTVVSEEEILSDSVYYYDSAKKCISVYYQG